MVYVLAPRSNPPFASTSPAWLCPNKESEFSSASILAMPDPPLHCLLSHCSRVAMASAPAMSSCYPAGFWSRPPGVVGLP